MPSQQVIRRRPAQQRPLLLVDDVSKPTSTRSDSSLPSAVGTTDTSTPNSPAAFSNAATNDSGWEDNSLSLKDGYNSGVIGRIFHDRRNLVPTLRSDSVQLDVFRDEIRNSTIVTSKITQLVTKSPLEPTGRVTNRSLDSGVEGSVGKRSTFELIGTDRNDDEGGDECNEEIRMPVLANERRVLVEDDVPSGPALDLFLDDLIFDPNKDRLIPPFGSAKVIAHPNDGAALTSESMHSHCSSSGQYEEDDHDCLDGSVGPFSTGILNTFLQQNSRYPRPTDARTVCIEPSQTGSKGSSLSLHPYSVAGDQPCRDPSRNENEHGRCRSTSHRSRRGRIQRPRERDSDDFEVRSCSPGRSTNRISLIRTMDQDPVLFDPIPEPTKKSTGRSPKSKKSEKSTSKRHGCKKSTTPKKGGEDDRKSIRKSKKKPSSGKKKSNSAEKGNEVEGELNRSFLDMFLDHEVEADDSASPQATTEDFTQGNRRSVEEYTAYLTGGPLEESMSKLRIEPNFLESSERMLLDDPTSRRNMMKKMKSVPTLGNPVNQLLESFLYDEDKDEEDKPMGACVCGSPVKAPESPKKNPTSPKATKTKKASIKKKSPTKKGSTNKLSGESNDKKSSNEKVKGSLFEEMARSLPRQLNEIEADGRMVLQSLLPKKSKSLSNLFAGEDDDVDDRLFQVERLNYLSKLASILQNDNADNFLDASKEVDVEQSPSGRSKTSSRKIRVGGKTEKKSPEATANETTTLDASPRQCTLSGRRKEKTSNDGVAAKAVDVPSADSEGHINSDTSTDVMKTMAPSGRTEEAPQCSPIVGRRTKPRKTSSVRDESTSTQARKAVSKLPASSDTRWQSEVVGVGVMDDHKTGRPRSLRSIRRAPLQRVRSSSKNDFAQSEGNASAHGLKSGAIDDDDEEIYKAASPSSKSKRKVDRKHDGKPPSTQNLASLEAKIRSSNIIRIVEGSILELREDSTICSELTTDVALLSSSIREKLNSSRSDLSAITEGGTASWAELSTSDSISKDPESHLHRRWHSQPSGMHANNKYADDKHVDDKYADPPQSPKKNFNWFKKSNPFNKK